MSRIYLTNQEMPRNWYNIVADLPFKLDTYLHPVTKKPVMPDDMASIFPPGLIEQEMSTQAEIQIPQEVMDVYSTWRATPLIRARALEKALDTPAKIYFKYEGTSHAGSHKVTTAVAQAYYNKIAGIKKVTTETGAGQWGCSVAYAAKHFGLDCEVYMVRVSLGQKPYRASFMKLFGADVIASPSDLTESGRRAL